MFKRVMAGVLFAAAALGLVAAVPSKAEANNGRQGGRNVVVVRAGNGGHHNNFGVRFAFNGNHAVAVPVAVAPVAYAAPVAAAPCGGYSFAAPVAAPAYQYAAPVQYAAVQPVTQYAFPAAQPVALPVQSYQAPVCAAPAACPVAAAPAYQAPVCASPVAGYSYAAPVLAAPAYSYSTFAATNYSFAGGHRVAFAANNHRVAVQRVVVVQQRRQGLFNRGNNGNNGRVGLIQRLRNR